MKELSIKQAKQLAECKDRGEYNSLLASFTDVTPQAAKFYQEAHGMMQTIYARWLDEHEHEDLKGYWQTLQPIAARCGVEIESMTGRPFCCFFSVGDRQFRLTMSSKVYTYRRIK